MLAAFDDGRSLPEEVWNIICSDLNITSLVKLSQVSTGMNQCMQNLTASWLRIKFPIIHMNEQIPNVLPYLKSIIWYYSDYDKKIPTLNELSQLRGILYGLWILQCYFLPKELPQLNVNSLFPVETLKTDILRFMLDFATKKNLIHVLERFLSCTHLEISAEDRKTLLTGVFISSANKGRLEVMRCLKDAPEISNNLEYITNFNSLFEKAARRGDTDMLIFLKESTYIKPFCMGAALDLAKRKNQQDVIDLFTAKGWVSDIDTSDFCLLQEERLELKFSTKSSEKTKSTQLSSFSSEDIHKKKDKHVKKRDNCSIQ